MSNKPTPSDIRGNYIAHVEGGHFFDRETMRFFGDTMKSFKTIEHEGDVYLYRRPDVKVSVFGTWKQVGREHFNAWKYDPKTHDLDITDNEVTQAIFDAL